jgi:hypothetical protein
VNKFSKAKSDGNETHMFVGMDLHKSYLQVAVLDGKGKVLKNSRIHNDDDDDEVGRLNTLNNSEEICSLKEFVKHVIIHDYCNENVF